MKMKKIRMAFALVALLTVTALAAETDYDVEAFIAGHGSLVSTTEEAVTEEQLDTMCRAAAAVTLGTEKDWQLTVIRDADLLQELLPLYTESGLVKEGNAAIIVSVTSDTSMDHQYEVEDHTTDIMGGMIAQQLCVAAQMQGLGFKVITDALYESSYYIYRDNITDEAHLIKAGSDRTEWLREFAILREKYYVEGASGEYITVMDGKYVPLKNGKLEYFNADGTNANKKKLQYVDGYMTPVAIVLVGNTDEEGKRSGIKTDNVVTWWDGEGDAYPTIYGASGHTSEGGYKK